VCQTGKTVILYKCVLFLVFWGTWWEDQKLWTDIFLPLFYPQTEKFPSKSWSKNRLRVLVQKAGACWFLVQIAGACWFLSQRAGAGWFDRILVLVNIARKCDERELFRGWEQCYWVPKLQCKKPK
jgi:hypothetical protein